MRGHRATDRLLRLGAIAVACGPALALAGRYAIEGLGADPIKDWTHTTGRWALRFLLISLAVTPIRRFAGLRGIAPLRRTFGLAAFAYALAHLLIWSVLDLGLEPAALVEDVTERPYVMAGMAAFAILATLAATSTRAAMKRLGARWVSLHRAVYAAALLALLHYFWQIKADLLPAWIHAAILTLLFAARLLWRFRRPASGTA
ncbi:MAG: sulfoxide reductase heme-binding subunit YedZ [Deltaproteobacteria bacterium]|nr:sulfoxide reductase heme-binding subunit YedZ [Deltaproteobacteria bacterium]